MHLINLLFTDPYNTWSWPTLSFEISEDLVRPCRNHRYKKYKHSWTYEEGQVKNEHLKEVKYVSWEWVKNNHWTPQKGRPRNVSDGKSAGIHAVLDYPGQSHTHVRMKSSHLTDAISRSWQKPFFRLSLTRSLHDPECWKRLFSPHPLSCCSCQVNITAYCLVSRKILRVLCRDPHIWRL